jgi:hypothetical protein
MSFGAEPMDKISNLRDERVVTHVLLADTTSFPAFELHGPLHEATDESMIIEFARCNTVNKPKSVRLHKALKVESEM